MTSLAVRNWSKFQHYRDRNPLWIKLYTELLDSREWLALSDVARAQLVGCWMLAAKRGNVLPSNPKELRVLIGSREPMRLDELLQGGWLEELDVAASSSASKPASGDASKRASKSASRTASKSASTTASTAASASRASAPSREGERELEGEPPPPAHEGVPLNAIGAFLGAVPPERRLAWQQTIANWPNGMGYPGGKAADPRDIEVGLLEYLAADLSSRDFAPQHVVTFVVNAERRRLDQSRPPHAKTRDQFGTAGPADQSVAQAAFRVASHFTSSPGDVR